MGNDGSDKREVHQGRNQSREPIDDTPIGMDLNVAPLVTIG
ncbi:MAG: hypothetical protein V3U20_09885 [Thermoplasmata archaeon]